MDKLTDIHSDVEVKVKGGIVRGFRIGRGKKVVICMHGFGDHAGIYKRFARLWGAEYTIYAFDLPFHGKTEWELHEYGPDQLAEAISGIPDPDHTGFVIIAYSYSGRLIPQIITRLSANLCGVCLVAPDGFYTHRWLDIDRVPVIFRKFSGLLMSVPVLPQLAIHGAHKTRMISRVLRDFCLHNLKDKVRRQRLIQTWISVKNFPVKQAAFYDYLNRQQIPILLVLGKDDQVIRPGMAAGFIVEVPHAELLLMDQGHRLINETLYSTIFPQIENMLELGNPGCSGNA